MQDFRNLLVWQKAHELALHTYRITNDFPRDEVFGLRNMMRKTSIDIPAQIAEGAGKPSNAEFAKMLSAAIGFTNRLEYYAIMSRDLEFLTDAPFEEFTSKLIEVRKMISGFNRKVGLSAI
jgi:four helix bundle protein